MPLAIAHARLGAEDDALRHCALVDATFRDLGTRGMNLGLACETRARVAMERSDWSGFQRFAALTGDHFRGGTSAPLAAKHQRLLRDAQRRDPARRVSGSATNDADAEIASVAMALAACATPEDRLSRALTMLLERSGASEGALLTPDGGQLVVRAQVGDAGVPSSVLASAQQFWEAQCHLADATEITAGTETGSSTYDAGDRSYHPILLSHQVSGGLALTGIALAVPAHGNAFRHPAHLAVTVSRVVMGDEGAIVVNG
jgi:hypothetical protein